MSRGSNRNKVGGVATGKKNKSNDGKTVNIPILIAVLVGVAIALVVGIISNSDLQGGLTMMNPMMNNQKRGSHVNMNQSRQQQHKFGQRHVQKKSVNVPPGQMEIQNNGNHVFVPVTPAGNGNGNGKARVIRRAEVTTGKPELELQVQPDPSFVNGVTRSVSTSKGDAHHSRYYYYYFDPSSGSFQLKPDYTTYPARPTKVVSVSATADDSFQFGLSLSGKYLPSFCKDGQAYGFSDLATLRNAVHELSDAYTYAVERWQHYHLARAEYESITKKAPHANNIQSPPPLPEHLQEFLNVVPDPFVICPGVHLRSLHGRHGQINIDAEGVVIECDSCIIDAPGTHFSFGPHAKNVAIRGITLMGATDTSLTFHHDGADVLFEDCLFMHNDGMGVHGAVADMNSTRLVVSSIFWIVAI